ncbi:MAG: YbaK/EbsC family protein [Phascolarctobacterium sp.]|nr:YbaK/EbsC family protein [Phascolarctobacterium sp.]
MSLSEQEILQLLEKHHINYIVRKHEPIFTVAEGEALGLPNVQAAVKSLLLTDDKHQSFYLVVLPLDKRLDLKELRAKIGSRRLTMASAEELMRLLQLSPGAVTPFGLLQDVEHKVQTFFDAELKENTIATHLDSNTATVWLKCQKLVHLLEEKGHESTYLSL